MSASSEALAILLGVRAVLEGLDPYEPSAVVQEVGLKHHGAWSENLDQEAALPQLDRAIALLEVQEH